MTPNNIISEVCKEFDVKKKNLFFVTRLAEIVDARQVSFYMMRKLLKLSYRNIGTYFVRNHTTVGFGCRAVVRRMRRDTVMKKKIKKIETRLRRF